MTIGEQTNLAATYKRMPKLKLVGQALGNFLIAEDMAKANDNQGKRINELIDEVKRLRAALKI